MNNPVTIASKRIEYLGINLIKEIKEALIKESEDSTDKWKDITCS